MQTYWGAGSKNADVEFEKSFGTEVKHEEVYYDPRLGIDNRARIGKSQMLAKQSIDTSTGGAGTAGFAMIPVSVIMEVIDQTRAETPLVEMFARRANRGMTHDFNKLTAKGGANFRFEDGALPDDEDTYDRASVPIKFGYSVGRVTGPSIAGWMSTGRGSAVAQDLAVKTQAIKELEENTIINGDLSTNPEEYDGLIQGISTNTTNLSGVAVTLADIRAEIATTFNAFGRVTLAVTDASTHNYVKGLLQDFQRQPAPPAEGLKFGIPGAFQFDELTFIKSQYMPTTSAARRILCLDMRYIYMAVLLDVTYQELAQTNDSNKYMLKVYEALVLTYEGSSSQIYGIL